jgi:hypothetical protein
MEKKTMISPCKLYIHYPDQPTTITWNFSIDEDEKHKTNYKSIPLCQGQYNILTTPHHTCTHNSNGWQGEAPNSNTVILYDYISRED